LRNDSVSQREPCLAIHRLDARERAGTIGFSRDGFEHAPGTSFQRKRNGAETFSGISIATSLQPNNKANVMPLQDGV